MRVFGWPDVWLLTLAFRWTLALSAVAFVGGGLFGCIVAIMRTGPSPTLRRVTAVYIKIVQGIPLLILLFLVYFGPTLFKMRTDAWVSAAIAFSIYASAFLGEIWRGCIEAVPKGQWDAARALGFRFPRTMILIIAPQAIRIALGPTVGFLVQLIKGTSVASIVGFVEITRMGQMISSTTFQPLLVFSLVAVFYFVLCWPLSIASARLENRLARRGVRLPVAEFPILVPESPAGPPGGAASR